MSNRPTRPRLTHAVAIVHTATGCHAQEALARGADQVRDVTLGQHDADLGRAVLFPSVFLGKRQQLARHGLALEVRPADVPDLWLPGRGAAGAGGNSAGTFTGVGAPRTIKKISAGTPSAIWWNGWRFSPLTQPSTVSPSSAS